MYQFFFLSLLSGKTRQVENSQFQTEPLPVFVYYTPLPINGLELHEEEKSRTYFFVTSIDEKKTRAKKSFDYGTCTSNLFMYLNCLINIISDL